MFCVNKSTVVHIWCSQSIFAETQNSLGKDVKITMLFASFSILESGGSHFGGCKLSHYQFSQEWSMSNFSCSLTRKIASHSMENMAFHSSLRWNMIVLANSHCITYTCLRKRLGECIFWTLEPCGTCAHWFLLVTIVLFSNRCVLSFQLNIYVYGLCKRPSQSPKANLSNVLTHSDGLWTTFNPKGKHSCVSLISWGGWNVLLRSGRHPTNVAGQMSVQRR